ncbi:hypothetical protein [Mycobacterium sp. ACS1612]|uniref:hypothetical protein n=1 Tax=Mycobacterium sp. ACS1612 TaxID=1834117 RepID=UPI0012EAB8F6|nr:hypothetical protein [Mycobacterium sp. ACS1612]
MVVLFSRRIAVHAAERIRYAESPMFCFTKEIAMLLTLSSLQFAVAVGGNHTVKTLGLRTALSADRAGRRQRCGAGNSKHSGESRRRLPVRSPLQRQVTDGFSAGDCKLFTCADGTPAEVIVSQSDSWSLPPPSPPLDITSLVPINGNAFARNAAQRQGGLPASECSNQGMSAESASEPMNGERLDRMESRPNNMPVSAIAAVIAAEVR